MRTALQMQAPVQTYSSVPYSASSSNAYSPSRVGVTGSPYIAPLSPRFTHSSVPLHSMGSPLRSSGTKGGFIALTDA